MQQGSKNFLEKDIPFIIDKHTELDCQYDSKYFKDKNLNMEDSDYKG